MCWLTGVFSNTSVCTVSSTAAWWGAVALCVANEELVGIKSLALAVGNSVRKKISDDSGSLHGPPSLVSMGIALLGHGLASNTTSVFGERHNSLAFEHILKELIGLGGGHSLDVVDDLSAVLEMHAEVRSP